VDVDARPAAPGDRDALVALARDAVELQREKRGGVLWARTSARAIDPRASLGADLERADTRVAVGTIDGVPLGYAVAHIDVLDDTGRLAVVTDLYVDPEARGVGVGEALMNHLVAWATDEGCFGIDSVALPGDRHTKNFFESFGLVARSLTVHRELG
jgi:GNAT superfamily N-acetyltransferase